MPAMLSSLVPCPGPILARTARPLSNWVWVSGPSPRPRALFFFLCSVSGSSLPVAHQFVIPMGQFFCRCRDLLLCTRSTLSPPKLPQHHKYTLLVIQSVSKQRGRARNLSCPCPTFLPQVVRLSRPLLPAGRIVPMYSRQIPLTGGRHVRSVSRLAMPCPGC